MVFFTSCFSKSKALERADKAVLTEETSIRAAYTADKSGLLRLEECAIEVQNTSSTVQPYGQDQPCLLQELQLALGALEGYGFEKRTSLLTSAVQEQLGLCALVRLYGLTPDDNDPHVLHLVQLAASAGRGWDGLWCGSDNLLPGHSFTLSPVSSSGATHVQAQSMISSAHSSCDDRGDSHFLLEKAISSKKPAMYVLGDAAHPPSTGKPVGNEGAGLPPSAPPDCAAQLGGSRRFRTMAFATVPLAYGKRLMGALWLAVADPWVSRPGGDARWDNIAAAACAQRTARSQALLCDGAALVQLGLSASMALALAASGDLAYVSWLSACVRRVAACNTLHTLVAGVCSALSRHVRLRFHADVTVQSALVPEPDSQVAFMLCLETKAMGGGSVGSSCFGSLAPVPKGEAHRSDQSAADTQSQRPKSGVISKSNVHGPVRRVASQAVLHPRGAAASERAAAGSAEAQAAAARSALTTLGLLTETMPAVSAVPPGLTCRDRDCPDGTPRSTRSPPGAASAVSGPVLYMSAKAFQLSHTLLSRLVGNARMRSPPTPVPPGFIVPDTARHVADVRQPSRDVCMLIGAKGSIAGSLWQQGGGAGGGGSSSGGVLDQSAGSSRSGPASLLLLAMEVAEGGCMLALYVAFPTLMPQPLLTAARDSCDQLLRQMLVQLVRHKLQSPQLGPDLDTLRAGVPGSYVSVSRIRDHVDRLQLPLVNKSNNQTAAQPQLPHAMLAATAATATSFSERCRSQQAPAQDEAGSLTRSMAAWNAGRSQCGVESPRANGQGDQAANFPPPQLRAHPESELDTCASEPPVTSPPSVRLAGDACDARSFDSRGKVNLSPLPAAKLFSTRGGWVHPGAVAGVGEPGFGGSVAGSGSAMTTPPASGPTCTAMHLSGSTHGGCVLPASCMRTPSFVSGLPSGVGCFASAGAMSTMILDSTAEGAQEGRGPQTTALMTVHGVDDTWCMRGMMGALVESIMTTLRASVSELADECLHGNDLGGFGRAVEGLEDLHLAEVLGHGASGVVLRGTLGTVPVAVKLMEMPDADDDMLSTEGGLAQDAAPLTSSREEGDSPQAQSPSYPAENLTDEMALVKSLASMAAAPGSCGRQVGRNTPAEPAQQQQRGPQQQQPRDDDGDNGNANEAAVVGPQQPQPAPHPHPSRFGRQQTESEQMRARRTMLRNATELAVMRVVSHVCIIQVFAVYDNVIMERPPEVVDSFVLRRHDPKNPDTGGSPICTAIVQELCDCGSLADVLANRSFPALLQGPRGGAGRAGGVGGMVERTGSRWEIDMKGVYLTLLEIALALRHLHSRRLVHRDVKPANILLKSSPGDPRGWTCKLADFGFALVLDQQEKISDAKEEASKTASPVGYPVLGLGSNSSAGNTRTWYTVQAQASGTVTHMAPEAVTKNSRIDASVDIYALGIIFWELVCGRGHRPFRHLDPAAIPAAVLGGMRPVFTADVPQPYRKMAQACWAADPHRRPRAADVVSFIKSQLASIG